MDRSLRDQGVDAWLGEMTWGLSGKETKFNLNQIIKMLFLVK